MPSLPFRIRRVPLLLVFAAFVPFVAAGTAPWATWLRPAPHPASVPAAVPAAVPASSVAPRQPDLLSTPVPTLRSLEVGRDERFLNLLIGKENLALGERIAELNDLKLLTAELNRVRVLYARSRVGLIPLHNLARVIELQGLLVQSRLALETRVSAAVLQQEIQAYTQLAKVDPGNPDLTQFAREIRLQARLGTALSRPPVSQSIPGPVISN